MLEPEVQEELEMDAQQETNAESEEESSEQQGASEFVDTFQMFSVIESLLFISDKPLTVGTLKSAFHGTNVNTKMIKKALEEMQTMYADPTRGVSLEEINGGWQLRTKLDNMNFLKRVNKTRPFRLSGPALEVLAIIAYKQPIVKNEVDQIRGVESGHLIRALMEKGLVCFQGKSDLPGKPMMYGSTRKFLEIFGLRNLKELPTLEEIDQLLPDGIGEEEEKETLSDVTDSMSEEVASSYSEGEEELEQITEKLGAIDTSSEFFEEEKRRQREKRDRDRAQDIREALAVDEPVDDKDVKWLERYEAKLALEAAEAEASAEIDKEALQALSSEAADEQAVGTEPQSVKANDNESDVELLVQSNDSETSLEKSQTDLSSEGSDDKNP